MTCYLGRVGYVLQSDTNASASNSTIWLRTSGGRRNGGFNEPWPGRDAHLFMKLRLWRGKDHHDVRRRCRANRFTASRV